MGPDPARLVHRYAAVAARLSLYTLSLGLGGQGEKD
jgi:hypothetical protein